MWSCNSAAKREFSGYRKEIKKTGNKDLVHGLKSVISSSLALEVVSQ